MWYGMIENVGKKWRKRKETANQSDNAAEDDVLNVFAHSILSENKIKRNHIHDIRHQSGKRASNATAQAT